MGTGVEISPVRYVRIEDADVAYQVYGDGPVDVLVLPGGIWDIDMIRFWPGGSFLEHLAALGCRVITFDRRGMGRSDRPVGSLSMDGMLDDISVVLDAVGSERAAFFAISEGGPMSLLYAAANPDRVSHLVLWGSFARFLDPGDGSGALTLQDLSAFREAVAGHWGTGMTAPLVLPSMLDDPAAMAYWARFERAAHTPRSLMAELDLASRIDLSDPATAVQCPTLVMHATGDRLVPISAGRYLAQRIEGSRFLEFDGIDHIIGPATLQQIIGAVWEHITGDRPVADVERSLATVLLTDIVGSTEHAAELGDRQWRAVLDRHDEVAADEVTRFGGRIVKRMGDGILAVFDRPGRGVRCATTLCERMSVLGVDLRAGLHVGEIELRGDDVGGIGVHIAARVEAAAGPGEVFVSRTITDVVAGSGLTFEDRGEHQLKGVPGNWQLFAAAADTSVGVGVP